MGKVELATGQIWQHIASGDRYLCCAIVDSEGVEMTRFWRHWSPSSSGMLLGSPKDTPADRFFDEFELVGTVAEER